MRKLQDSNQKGFTLVELLLALAVFSFVLVFVTTAFLQLFRTYNRGITRKEVNQSTRILMDDITDKLRIVGDPALVKYNMVDQGRLCVGNYSYVWNKLGATGTKIRVSDTGANLKEVNVARIDNDNLSACQTPIKYDFTNVQATSMFTERMAIQAFTVTPTAGGVAGLFTISVTASTNQTNFLDAVFSCNKDTISTAYCAKLTLQETVGLRNR